MTLFHLISQFSDWGGGGGGASYQPGVYVPLNALFLVSKNMTCQKTDNLHICQNKDADRVKLISAFVFVTGIDCSSPTL